MTFEITSLAAKDTFTLELHNADDEPLHDADGNALSVTIYGPGSKVYAKEKAAQNQRLINRVNKRGKVKLSLEEQRSEAAKFLAACTVSFNGWVYQGKADQESIEAAYNDPSIGFIVEQVDRAIGDWANFTKNT